jgi:hypothetical protein
MTGVLYTWINSGTICAKNIAGKRLERMLVIMNDIQLELLFRGNSAFPARFKACACKRGLY